MKFDPIKHKDGEKSSSVKSPSTKFKYIIISLIFGPILNAVNLWNTKPKGALIDYKLAFMKQVNTLDTVLEDFPQLLIHFYVVFVLSRQDANQVLIAEFDKKDSGIPYIDTISPKNLIQIKLIFALITIAMHV